MRPPKGCTRAAWDFAHGLWTLEELPGGVALPGQRRRRRHARVAVDVAGRRVSAPVAAPGERYARPGKEESERRVAVHRDARFLRGIVEELLRSGDWSACSADQHIEVLLWLGVDGIPPGGGCVARSRCASGA